MIYEHEDKHALSLKHWNTCHLIDSNTFLVPFLRQRSILSVMVILLSEMNSYRMRVAIAVLSPSSAPCLVLALRKKKKLIYIYINHHKSDNHYTMKPFIRKYWQPSVLPLSLLVDTTMISITNNTKPCSCVIRVTRLSENSDINVEGNNYKL